MKDVKMYWRLEDDGKYHVLEEDEAGTLTEIEGGICDTQEDAEKVAHNYQMLAMLVDELSNRTSVITFPEEDNEKGREARESI